MKMIRICQIVIIIMLGAHISVTADNRLLKTGAFEVTHQLTLPGSPDVIFDTVTGDISKWWDHSMSETPLKFYIEPQPGGGFFEIFDQEGNGVQHAEVIYADRGKLLRFDGPLGLSGSAIQVITSYQFYPVGTDSTRLEMTLHAIGEMQEDWPEVVDRVWYHFLFERLKPFVENGKIPLAK